MQVFLLFLTMFISVPAFSKVVAVPLSASAQSALNRIYEETRGRADCCGIGRVLVYRVLKGSASSQDIQDALKLASAIDEDINYAWNSELFESRKSVRTIEDFVAFYGKSGFNGVDLSRDVKTLVNEIKKTTGETKLITILSADIQPAPSVDGSVDVAVTVKEDVIIIRVNDFGA